MLRYSRDVTKKINFPLRRVILFSVWLSFLVQSSWADPTQDVSFSGNAPQTDTVMISDRWVAWDKAEHLGVSAFLCGVSYSIFRDFYRNQQESSIYFSAAFTFSAGLGKEFCDQKTPQGRFSYKDLVADILGIGLGLLIATR